MTRSIRITVAEHALIVMRRRGITRLWFGLTGALEEIAAQANIKAAPRALSVDRHATVLSAIAKSHLFEPDGMIEHIGRRYPVWRIRGAATAIPAEPPPEPEHSTTVAPGELELYY